MRSGDTPHGHQTVTDPADSGLKSPLIQPRPMRLDRGMDALAGPLITTFDYAWARLTGRLSGLTDEEYFWEPVAGCWSLRQGQDGRWHLDGGGGGGPAPDPAPVTTIAWRLGHLGGMAVGGSANRRFGDAKLTTDQIGADDQLIP
jgi:hypothetical protein